MSKWISVWGTATSVAERREANYAANITLRYKVKCVLDGEKIRVRFSNICGSEPVKMTSVCISNYKGNSAVDAKSTVKLTFKGQSEGIIEAGGEITSDEADFVCRRGEDIAVSIYLKDMTQMMSCVYTEGPCTEGFFIDGDFADAEEFPMDKRMPSGCTYFLNTVDVLSSDDAKAVILFGDSITAQSWPDRFALKIIENNINTAPVRRGVSGTRILGQYDCLQYAHYGLSGRKRFVRECTASGADCVIIFHGVNDIIHPDGINPYRPMSNFPSLEEMKEGFRYYISEARKMGLKVYIATILPIEGWRTYEIWRNDLREQVNNWIRTTDEIDGYIDFDEALRDEKNPKALKPEYNSGDSLHPSSEGAQALADKCFETMKNYLINS